MIEYPFGQVCGEYIKNVSHYTFILEVFSTQKVVIYELRVQ